MSASKSSDRPLAPSEFLAECVEFKAKHLTGGRFLIAMIQGELTRAQLDLWAKDMYHFVQPGIPALTAWLAHAPTTVERESARLIARNLVGELGYLREADHRDLYLKLLRDGFGISEETAREHLPQPGTIGATTALCAFCRSSWEEGIGAFGLALEMQIPGRPNGAAVLYQALKRYGIDEDALEFYRIHEEAEEEHGDNAERAVAPFIQTREQQALVRHAFRWTVLALGGMQAGFDRYLA